MPEFDIDEEIEILTDRMVEFLKPKIRKIILKGQKEMTQSIVLSSRTSKVDADKGADSKRPGRPRKLGEKSEPLEKKPVGRPRGGSRREKELDD